MGRARMLHAAAAAGSVSSGQACLVALQNTQHSPLFALRSLPRSPMARGISGGQAKRVNIGIALVTNPRVLFLGGFARPVVFTPFCHVVAGSAVKQRQ